MEERQETEAVFRGDKDSNDHFEHIGLVLGLVRIKDLHLGKIADLREQLKESKANERTNDKPEPGSAGGHTSEQ